MAPVFVSAYDAGLDWGPGFARSLGFTDGGQGGRPVDRFAQEGSPLSATSPSSTPNPPAEVALRGFGADDRDEARFLGLTLGAWLKIAIVAALFAALFWPSLRRLWLRTRPIYGDPAWGHAICIPLIGLYYLYVNRDELLRQVVKPAWSGLAFLLLGILVFTYGIWPGQNDFVRDTGMIVSLFGIVLVLAGWAVMKVAWFPIAYLMCGIPWPGQVYSWVAGPLQFLAANAAVLTLRLTGVHAAQQGTKIFIPDRMGEVTPLNVAEACAGLRSLMTFITVGAAVAFLSNRPLWQKVIITASAVPIAVFCNMLRVAGQGVLHYYVSEQLSQSFAHQFVGVVMLLPAFFLIMLVGWVLDHLFIEVDEADSSRAGEAASDMVINVARPQRGEA